MDEKLSVLRTRVNGSLLGQFIGKSVSLIGTVIKVSVMSFEEIKTKKFEPQLHLKIITHLSYNVKELI